MLDMRVRLMGGDLVLEAQGSGVTRKPLGAAGLARFAGWAKAYDAALRANDLARLPILGREVADFLNEGDGWLTGKLQSSVGPIHLEITAPTQPNAEERALLDLPWELLAPAERFLAEEATRPFLVARRLGQAGTAREAEHGDLMLLFMAAEVEGQSPLDYEAEEIAFLDATQNLDAQVAVEESGGLEGLEQRLRQATRPEVLHLTCHGDLDDRGAYLALETPEGGLDRVDAGRLCGALGDENHLPGLVFLSACRTAEQGQGDIGSLVQAMIQTGVPNALGWDGSVRDETATAFAAIFHGELAGGQTVVHAAARARREVLNLHQADPDRGAHWHLARVWLGPGGGGALCAPGGKPTRALPPRRDRVYLDKRGGRVPVAPPERFVGRRRPIQATFRAWTRGAAGVLVQGMGNLGKSSLAERVASRMDGYHRAVVFERYDAHAVFLALVDALPELEQAAFRQTHEQTILNGPEALKPVLQALLKGAFSGHNGTQPILLILDDLERCLEPPKAGQKITPFRSPEQAAVIAAIVGAFKGAGGQTKSRLLITCRYDFALTNDRGEDLREALTLIPLPPMDAAQRQKQMRTAIRLSKRAWSAETRDLEARIREAASGNPGLQEILTRPLLEIANPEEALATAETAVAAVEHYLGSGEAPEEENAAQEFFERVSLEAFRDMLTPAETRLLQATTLFPLPVPFSVLEVAGEAAGVREAPRLLRRLQGLGLLDHHGEVDGAPHGAINPLARPLVPPLSEDDERHLAKAVVEPLYRAWNRFFSLPIYSNRAVQVTELALSAKGPGYILNISAEIGSRYLLQHAHEPIKSLDLIYQSFDTLIKINEKPTVQLIRSGIDCTRQLGLPNELENFLNIARQLSGQDPISDSMALIDWADFFMQRGDLLKAEEFIEQAINNFESLDETTLCAMATGRMADVLKEKGNIDEALSLLKNNVMPVFIDSGDERSAAVTLGRIADILFIQGKIVESLNIRLKEQLPIFDRQNNIHERAMTMGAIADIYNLQGNFNEALRIRYEEELPIYERLGNVRARAITMGHIADTLMSLGQFEKAIDIREKEEIPIYEKLGDVRSRAITMGKIAHIHSMNGDFEEALNIHMNEEISIFKKIGDVRSLAVALGDVADILEKQGNFKEAIRINLEERLPIVKRIGDKEGMSHILFFNAATKIKNNLVNKDNIENVLDDLRESYEIAIDIGSTVAISQIAPLFGQSLILANRTQEALSVLDEAVTAHVKLGRTKNVTQIRAFQERIRKDAQ